MQQKAADIVNSGNPSVATNEGQDTLSQLLGPDNPGRMRAMGRNMSKTKLACFQVKHKCMAEMEENQINLQHKVNELQKELAKLKKQVIHFFNVYIMLFHFYIKENVNFVSYVTERRS